jgi:outer membrane protein TolC
MNRPRRCFAPSSLRAFALVLLATGPAFAQPAPIEPIAFDEAVRRAMMANPSVAIAAASILRAEALLKQAQAVTRPQVSAQGSNLTLDSSREVDGDVVRHAAEHLLDVGSRVDAALRAGTVGA